MTHELKKGTQHLGFRQPPAFEVCAVEISTKAGRVHIRLETPSHVCFDFVVETASALKISHALEAEYLHAEGLHE